MKLVPYQIAEVLSLLVTFGSAIALTIVLVWLTFDGGVIACGRGIFDSQAWLTDLMLIIGIPASVMIGSLRLFFWFAKQEEESSL